LSPEWVIYESVFMPNESTITFFLLDSPQKKEEHYLHCFGAGLIKQTYHRQLTW